MAEGAIEGDATDYIMKYDFDTDFKYSLYHTSSIPTKFISPNTHMFTMISFLQRSCTRQHKKYG